MTTDLKRTPLHTWHTEHGARMTDFGGWDMPVQYSSIIDEHLATRRAAGLFDISHMGRIRIAGPDRIPFMQRALTNDAAALSPWRSHYTLLPTPGGSTIDDAFLYHLSQGDYLLVVNAANRDSDLAFLHRESRDFNVEILDQSAELAMIALQGPQADAVLGSIVGSENLPEAKRNSVVRADFAGNEIYVARTGYTGEPVALEVFVPANVVGEIWQRILDAGQSLGVVPVGLGARDTLRLEAGLPLFGHEAGSDPEGKPIPAYAVPVASIAVKFDEDKGDFIGREPLHQQYQAVQNLRAGKPFDKSVLPRRIRPLAILDRGVARAGADVWRGGEKVGVVTSGTMVPYWVFEGETAQPTDQTGRRALALAYVDSELPNGEELQVEVRGRRLRARLVASHGNGRQRPYFRPILAE